MRLATFALLVLAACDPGKGSSASYDSCSGDPFTGGSCDDGVCADEGLSSQVYAIWRERFLDLHGLDEATFTDRVVVTDVSLTEGPDYVWWRVDYVFTVDWAMSRQNESVDLGEYPLASEPTTEEITRAVDIAIEEPEKFDLASVASLSAIEAALAECATSTGAPEVTLDLCHLDFENSTGTFYGKGWGTIDEQRCVSAHVDLETAELLTCETTVCSME